MEGGWAARQQLAVPYCSGCSRRPVPLTDPQLALTRREVGPVTRPAPPGGAAPPDTCLQQTASD